jgi:hypothetical protein
MNESTLSNVLIHQKDKLRQLIFDEKYEQAATTLEFVKEFWKEASYDYKYREIKEFITSEIRQNITNADHWKEREKWENLLHKLYPAKELV